MKKLLLLTAALGLTGLGVARVISNVYDLRFVRADANSDSSVSLDEFITSQTGLTRVVDAKHRFNLADTDASGGLSITEFRNSRGGVKGGRAVRYEAFQLADANHDGFLTLQEYADTEPKNRAGRLLANTFARRDKDSDGKLSLREFGVLVIPR
ncbi:MAG: hypothetical protein JWO82_1165 [Akkermansiaceae bacterium]|nr:hypothetical protein [Akkermansiaceae bacterium]